MDEKDMTRIINEYAGLSTKVDALSKTRSDEGAKQMDRASAEMDGIKKALLCMGYDIGRGRTGDYAIRKLSNRRK